MKLKGVIFSGGGLKGLSYIGCLKALEEADLVKDVTFFAGCSSGAIMASCMAIGYTSTELYDFILHFDYDKVKDINILGIFDNYGIESGNKIQNFIRLMLKKKCGLEDITFGQLYELRKTHLMINATCVTNHSVEYFDYKKYPDMPISLAIRMSIAIPFIFTPVRWNDKIYVDGGVMDNFPVHLYEDEFLGFKLGKKQENVCNSFISYAQNVWSSLYGELTRLKLSKGNYPIVNIETAVHTFNFILTQDERIQIYEKGYECTRDFIKEKNKSETTI